MDCEESLVRGLSVGFGFDPIAKDYNIVALHWVATETSNIRERMILTFNLSSHVFGAISLPEPSRRAEKLTILNGCLGVISRERWTTWIWVMREYDNVASWSLVHELGMKRFNRLRGDSSEVLKLKGTCRRLDMEMYVESFELLDKGTPCGKAISRE
ncbi:F-box/kelch-repeat protein-like protein [Tanacetum coccineum]